MKDQLEMLLQFNKTYDVLTNDAPLGYIGSDMAYLRYSLISEELEEYYAAALAGDLHSVSKELADLLYVVLGSIVAHGLQCHIEQIFSEVHRSNMSKLTSLGQVLRRADGKILKSSCYTSPDLVSILFDYLPDGYKR